MDIYAEMQAERAKQIAKGFNAAHDDEHTDGAIITAEWGALARLQAASTIRSATNRRHGLLQAAAMIVAEIERVDRVGNRTPLSEDA